MEQKHEFQSSDSDSQATKQEYESLLKSIEQRMDPESNTALVVDDEPSIRKLVARNIKKSSGKIVVYQAANGQDALERLTEIRERYSRDPLFIVTDLNMPIMDGWELVERLRQDYEGRGLDQGIPVIVLSSTSGEKGIVFRKSVHGGKARYNPMVTVAKEDSLKPGKYDASGEKGLAAWMKHFLRHGAPPADM